ncbi:MAG: triose-phosphate isomerase [Armatimonadetes bacterium]|nr:triose-phosphate isomerase [Armatimonadota bacterium]
MGKRVAVAAANWKMNKTVAEAKAYMTELAGVMQGVSGEVEVVVFAPFLALRAVAKHADAARVGAQDCFWHDSGAFTGEVSVPMLVDVGCTDVLVGHSERRRRFGVPEQKAEMAGEVGSVFGDNDASVNQKLLAGVRGGLRPCLCVGESEDERKRGETDAVIEAQLRRGLAEVDAATVAAMLIAYEPVWSIGTGIACEPPEANRVSGLVRAAVAALTDAPTADAVRIIYGGSMSPKNVADLLPLEHIDGGLVGGASLKVETFEPIIRACACS